MKLVLKFDWIWILQKVRILFLVAIFYGLYEYTSAVFAFVWICYFILNDLNDIETSIEEKEKGREEAWKSISTKRKGF